MRFFKTFSTSKSVSMMYVQYKWKPQMKWNEVNTTKIVCRWQLTNIHVISIFQDATRFRILEAPKCMQFVLAYLTCIEYVDVVQPLYLVNDWPMIGICWSCMLVDVYKTEMWQFLDVWVSNGRFTTVEAIPTTPGHFLKGVSSYRKSLEKEATKISGYLLFILCNARAEAAVGPTNDALFKSDTIKSYSQ